MRGTKFRAQSSQKFAPPPIVSGAPQTLGGLDYYELFSTIQLNQRLTQSCQG